MKTAIVTGATRGIGKAVALALLKDGYRVIGVYHKSSDIAKNLSKENNNLFFFQADVGNEGAVKKLVSFVKEKTNSIEVLVNNAGIEKYAKLEDYDSDDWDRMLLVNLKSVWLMTQKFLPLLKKAEKALIINISSRLGLPEKATSPYIVYGVTKAGVNMLTKGFSQELADYDIRVNAVFPTATKTDMIDYVMPEEVQKEFLEKGLLGKPKEVADMVVDIVNDDSMNGEFVYDERIK